MYSTSHTLFPLIKTLSVYIMLYILETMNVSWLVCILKYTQHVFLGFFLHLKGAIWRRKCLDESEKFINNDKINAWKLTLRLCFLVQRKVCSILILTYNFYVHNIINNWNTHIYKTHPQFMHPLTVQSGRHWPRKYVAAGETWDGTRSRIRANTCPLAVCTEATVW